jgi:hypothetical protein
MDSGLEMDPTSQLVMGTIMGRLECLLSDMMDRMKAIHEEIMAMIRVCQEAVGAAVIAFQCTQSACKKLGSGGWRDPLHGTHVSSEIQGRRWEVKMQLAEDKALAGSGASEEVLSRAHNQVLRLEAAKAAGRLPNRLQVVRAEVSLGSQSPGTKCSRTEKPICQKRGGVDHLRKDC